MCSFCAGFLLPKKLQTQTASTEKLRKTLSYKKAVHKMLVKLTSDDSLSGKNVFFDTVKF
jgi:hypothetical protein